MDQLQALMGVQRDAFGFPVYGQDQALADRLLQNRDPSTALALRAATPETLPAPQPPVMTPGEALWMLASAAPGVGDVLGVGADAYTLATEPEQRTIPNALLALSGILPFVPAGMTRMVGDVGDLAGRVAQRQARGKVGKETAEHVLDAAMGTLPMDEASRMARAKEMGFDPSTTLYHATSRDFPFFDVKASGTGINMGNARERAIFLTDSPAVADSYLPGTYLRSDSPDAAAHGVMDMGGGVGRHYSDGSQVLPVVVKNLDGFDVWDFGGGAYSPEDMAGAIKEARKAKSKGVIFENIRDPGVMNAVGPLGSPRAPSTVVAVFDPKDIRSRFANFDLSKAKSPDIMAAAAAVPASQLATMGEEDEQVDDVKAILEQWLAGGG